MVPSPPPAGDKAPCAPFHSHPSDLELVVAYLRPWVDSGVKRGAFIHEYDVYADDPAELTRQFAPAVALNGERAWYFLTPLRRKAKGGKRKSRNVLTGTGWWHGDAKCRPVVDVINGRRQVGHRQCFAFMKSCGGDRKIRTGWLMMELQVRAKRDRDDEGQALCKVYRSPRFPGERKDCFDQSTASPSVPKVKTDGDDGDDSEATQDDTAGRRKSDAEGSSAATVATPGKAGDEEVPVTPAGEAPGRKDKEADDGDSGETSTAVPGSKRKAAGDENSAAASTADPARTKSKIDADLHCPNCGCHLDVEALLAAAAKSKPDTKSETGIVQVPGDSSVIEHTLHQFF